MLNKLFSNSVKLLYLNAFWVTLLLLFSFWLKYKSGFSHEAQLQYLFSMEFFIPFSLISVAYLWTMNTIINKPKKGAKNGKK